jgi:multimeric flavodoxin WrbA
MKATIFLGSLKQKQSHSHSAYLATLVKSALLERGFKTVELIQLRKLDYEPGVDIRTESGAADDMTDAMKQLLESDCVIFATPIWWGVHSSLIQAFMERLCYYDDFAIKTGISPLYGKTFGAIISGSDDGFQQITGLLLNFATNLGFTVPPDAVVPCTMQTSRGILQDQRTQQHIALFARNQAAWTQLMRREKIGSQVQAGREPRPQYTNGNAPDKQLQSSAIAPPVRDYVKEQGL